MRAPTREAEQRAAAEAKGLRALCWGERLPVDPVRIARRLGISVLDAKLSPEIAGALVKEAGRDPVLLLNDQDSVNRKRFVCAYELGHFVGHHDDVEQYEFIDRRDIFAQPLEPEPAYARAFALALLLPRARADRCRRRRRADSLELALRFGVPREVACWS